jgi:hypothetical protein
MQFRHIARTGNTLFVEQKCSVQGSAKATMAEKRIVIVG